MNASEWWRLDLAEELEQGDILLDIPFIVPREPTVEVHKATVGKGTEAWVEGTQHAKQRTALATLEKFHGLVISHGCDIDKNRSRGRILIAPIAPLANVTNDADRLKIVNQEQRSTLPLPGIPTLGDYYAQLRLITPIPKEAVGRCTRVASMTDVATTRLHAQLVAFLLRKNLPL